MRYEQSDILWHEDLRIKVRVELENIKVGRDQKSNYPVRQVTDQR